MENIGRIISNAIAEVANEYKDGLGNYLGNKHPGHRCLMEKVLNKVNEIVKIPLIRCKHIIKRRRVLCRRCNFHLANIMRKIIHPYDENCNCYFCHNMNLCKLKHCNSMLTHNNLMDAYKCILCSDNNKYGAKNLRRFTYDAFYTFILCLKSIGWYRIMKDLLPNIYNQIKFVIVEQIIVQTNPLYDKQEHQWKNPITIFHESYLEDKNAYRNVNDTCYNTIYLYNKTCFLKSSPNCLGKVKYSGDDLKPMACVNCSKNQVLAVSPNYRPEEKEEKDLITKCANCNKFINFNEWHVCGTCGKLVFCSEICSRRCRVINFHLADSCYVTKRSKENIIETVIKKDIEFLFPRLFLK